MNAWVLLLFFVIAINILGALFKKRERKEKLSPKQSQGLYKTQKDKTIGKPSEKQPIDNEAEKYKRPQQNVKCPGYVEPIHWDIAFLKSLEWRRYEDICMEYLKIKNCAANVTRFC